MILQKDIELLREEGWNEQDDKVVKALGRVLGYVYPGLHSTIYAEYRCNGIQIYCERIPKMANPRNDLPILLAIKNKLSKALDQVVQLYIVDLKNGKYYLQ